MDSWGDGNFGWQSHVSSTFFPKTCAALQGIPHVSGKLLKNGGSLKKNCGNHDNDNYSDWCQGMEGQYAGVIAFYSLQPKTSLRLHTGPTNQLLKCHLVVEAPEDGSAWMQVGDIRKSQATGDVIAFDDSYLHAVGNEHPSQVRVILDVTFWHPDLAVDFVASPASDEL